MKFGLAFAGSAGTDHQNLASVLAVSLALIGVGGCAVEQHDDRPSVILVTIDTLRPDHLDLYGYTEETAPFIRSLGDEGAVFTNAFSTSSWTAPSTASLFTARYPVFHGVTLGINAHRELAEQIEAAGEGSLSLNRIPDELAVLPEILRNAGYTTFGMSTNLNVGDELGFDRGFDRFECEDSRRAETVRDRLRVWRDEILESEPWLLYLHLNDVHAPYQAQEPWYHARETPRQSVIAAYDSEIRYVDEILREIFSWLGSDGSALVLLVSDHGEEFWEHGQLGHRFSLHGEVNRVALLVHGPSLGVLPARRQENVSLMDVLPTLLDLLGVEGPKQSDGLSLAPLLRGEESDLVEQLRNRVLLGQRVDRAGTFEEIWSAIQGPWKLIERAGTRTLYHLASDPGELRDQASGEPSLVEALSASVSALRSSAADRPNATIEISIDRDRLEALRTLGYVEED